MSREAKARDLVAQSDARYLMEYLVQNNATITALRSTWAKAADGEVRFRVEITTKPMSLKGVWFIDVQKVGWEDDCGAVVRVIAPDGYQCEPDSGDAADDLCRHDKATLQELIEKAPLYKP